MKKLFLLIVLFSGGLSSINAQGEKGSSLSKGSFLIEINTGTFTTGSTAFSLASTSGSTAWSIGAEGGYFLNDNLALKVGLGYADSDSFDGDLVYKVGAKYYVDSKFPLGIDFTGSTVSSSANWVGVQGGYAWFVANNVSIEPTLRYNIGLDANNLFQGLIGFVFHF